MSFRAGGRRRDAVELRSKLQTNDFVIAAFYFLDEARATFASLKRSASLPSQTENGSVLPKETIFNYLVAPH